MTELYSHQAARSMCVSLTLRTRPLSQALRSARKKSWNMRLMENIGRRCYQNRNRFPRLCGSCCQTTLSEAAFAKL